MTFVPVPDFDELAQKDVKDWLVKAAEFIVGRAVERAPVRTGGYRRSLRVAADDRGVVAESTDIAGHLIESGSVNNPPYAPLRSSAAEVGRYEPK